MSDSVVIRPTMRQKQLLQFIAEFIAEHGYSPSYREIMRGCGYTSVATVALHVNSLISRGHLVKRNNSARSLEVINIDLDEPIVDPSDIKSGDEKWLVKIIDAKFKIAEEQTHIEQQEMDSLYVLVGALRVLGLDGAYSSFLPRIAEVREKVK
jgi:SOS-response transcriptional repressor LexA